MKMNKMYAAVPAALLLFASCSNQPNGFPDYSEQNVYFPSQYPVRTLVLGEDRLDNTIDREHAFSIGVCIGGMYENKQDWTVDYSVDPSLISGIKASGADGVVVPLEVLPQYYYTFEPDNTAIIPSGSFSGRIRVNLSDAFFEDDNAYKLHYVIPLAITSSSCPGILWGTPVEDPANIHRASDWMSTDKPRFFTLFGIKFINPWHGTFFHRGRQFKDGVLDKVFSYEELEKGQTAELATAGLSKSLYNRMGEFLDGNKYRTVLTFSEATDGVGDITLSSPEGSGYTVTGSGKYYESTTGFAREHGSWLVDPNTGKEIPHLTMVLDFDVDNLGGNNYHFVDTLVYRDNGVVFETFSPVIVD